MTTVVRGPRPPELEAYLERRRQSGSDRLDEVWEGSYVVAPDPHSSHGEAAGELRALLKPHAKRLGLRATQTFNLGDPDDYRIPDAGLVPEPSGVWHASAVLVVEVLSPDDMTFAKLDFYTARGVLELLVVDWQERSVRCFLLQEGQVESDRSGVLGLTTAEVVAAVDWPDDGPSPA